MTTDVILIAPVPALADLTARFQTSGTVRAFADTDALAALDATFDDLPRQVVLERLFAESLRGQAFLRCVTQDPFARECLIRVVDAPEPAPPATTAAPAASPTVAAPDAAAPQTAAPQAATSDAAAEAVASARATPRLPVVADTHVHVDGSAVTLVDLSTEGMQVLGAVTLRPNQAVRVVFPDEAVRLRARVAWATFEFGGGGPGPRYRAGLQFVDADQAVLDALVARLTAGRV